MVIDGPEFWAFLVMNITICTLRHMGMFNPENFHLDLPWDLTGTTGSLMTFFVVFYNSHVFGRYTKLYMLTKTMLDSAVKTAAMCRVCVPDERLHWKVCKYVMSSILIFFFERTTADGADEGDALSRIEWDQLQALDLLTEEEINLLQRHVQDQSLTDSSFPSFFPIQWSMELLRNNIADPLDRDDMLSAFYATLYTVWETQTKIKDTLELPMPFQYFHIMNLMMILNLFLWAYSLGCQDSWFAPIIYMFVQMMFQGLRELSTALSDPYGTDEVDFSLNEWLRPIYTQIQAHLNQHIEIDKMEVYSVKPMLISEYAHKHINMYIDREKEGEEQARRKQKKLAKEQAAPGQQQMWD